MKKIIMLFIFFISIFSIFIKSIFACSIPPDILNRFYIYEDNGNVNIEYSLFTWDEFKEHIRKHFKENTGKELNEENINIFIDKYIKDISNLTYNGEKVDLNFESVKFYKKMGEGNPFFEIKFSTQIKKLEKENNFELSYNKKLFSNITSLIHAYLYSDIEEAGNIDGFFKYGNERFDIYFFRNWKYGILSKLEKETNNDIEYKLDIKKVEEVDKESLINTNNRKDNPLLTTNKSNNLEINGIRVGKIFESFLDKDISIFTKAFGIIFAIVFGALHGLLPGHSKSIVGAYMMDRKDSKNRRNEVLVLITSITLSHTFFIFLLAFIIYFLNSGLGSSSSYVYLISSIGYTLFGIYFCYYAIKRLIKSKKIHSHGCSCCSHSHKIEQKSSYKKNILAGVLFGCNPCIDALVLFIFAFNIGNVFYATILIFAFSLGLGLMLGLLALLVGKGYNFLSNKNNNLIQKILNILVLILGIFIIIFGIYGILTNPVI